MAEPGTPMRKPLHSVAARQRPALRALGEGRATVESRIVHEGRRVVHAASTVTDDRGKTVALGDATLMIVLGDKKPDDGGTKS